jgi:hypothetical protein
MRERLAESFIVNFAIAIARADEEVSTSRGASNAINVVAAWIIAVGAFNGSTRIPHGY